MSPYFTEDRMFKGKRNSGVKVRVVSDFDRDVGEVREFDFRFREKLRVFRA
jgi:hypothetical protein